MNNLIEKVKEKQRELNLTDGELALLLGIDRSTWSKIKSGGRNPGMKFVRAIDAKLMALSMSDIIDHNASENSCKPFLGGLRGWLGDCIELWRIRRETYKEEPARQEDSAQEVDIQNAKYQ